MSSHSRLTRKTFLKTSSAAGAGLLLGSRLPATAAAAGTGAPLKGKNVVLFITDQERAIQHFPPGWAAKHLPGLTRLQQHGLTFDNAFTNACMCSPARSTMLTGLMPAQHGVRYTLEQDMPASDYPQVELSTRLVNLGRVMAAAGYHVVWKGKFHCSKPADPDGTWALSDVGRYGFTRWNPKDAGANQDLPEGGGGTYPGANNDDRYMTDDGDVRKGQEGALAYLRSVAAQQRPFFLVISLVNPHDVLFFPKKFEDSGYDPSMIDGDIELPATVGEDLSSKPRAQAAFLKIFNLSGALPTAQKKRAYLNFYANLMKRSDAYLVNTLDTLKAEGLLDDTVIIRTADHGEMGMTHGGMRQKNFNFYEEALRVPLVFSNPKLFPTPVHSKALVSHVDLVPTLASLVGTPHSARARWTGVDYSSVVSDPAAPEVQDYVVFTYDDLQAGQANGPYVPQPSHIVAIREQRWKLALYYDPGEARRPEWELYDLSSDPLERTNLAAAGYDRTAEQEREFQRLKRRLAAVKRTRLKPRRAVRAVELTANTKQISKTGTRFTDEGQLTGVPVGAANITLHWRLHPATGRATSTFTITSPSGLIRGRARCLYRTDGNEIALRGTAQLSAGTGRFEGIRNGDLAFTMTDTLDGQNGVVTMQGAVVY